LIFKKDVAGEHEFIRYIDSNYVEDLDKCWSTMGYVFILSHSWRFTLQSIVALSTIEAEYMTIIGAMKEAI